MKTTHVWPNMLHVIPKLLMMLVATFCFSVCLAQGTNEKRACRTTHPLSSQNYIAVDLEQLNQQQPHRQGCNGGYQSGHHERVIQNPFANAGSTRTVEVDSRYYGWIVRNEEISVYGRE